MSVHFGAQVALGTETDRLGRAGKVGKFIREFEFCTRTWKQSADSGISSRRAHQSILRDKKNARSFTSSKSLSEKYKVHRERDLQKVVLQ
jgi:hypothetical protein